MKIKYQDSGRIGYKKEVRKPGVGCSVDPIRGVQRPETRDQRPETRDQRPETRGT
jgi:hypothetical protein